MTKLQVLNFQDSPVRTEIDFKNNLWMCAKDLCDALGYTNPRDALKNYVHEDDVAKRDVIDSMGRAQKANFVNESGMYALIFGSKLPKAKEFKKWVTSEVLPQIRRTGTYMSAEEKEARLENYRDLYSIVSKLPKAKEFKKWVTSEVLPQIRRTGTYMSAEEKEARLENYRDLYSIVYRTESCTAPKHVPLFTDEQAQFVKNLIDVATAKASRGQYALNETQLCALKNLVKSYDQNDRIFRKLNYLLGDLNCHVLGVLQEVILYTIKPIVKEHYPSDFGGFDLEDLDLCIAEKFVK